MIIPGRRRAHCANTRTDEAYNRQSGCNVYPGQIENKNILNAHPSIHMSCITGAPDLQKVKAFLMLKLGVSAKDEMKEDILIHCRKNTAKYALPHDIEFRDILSQTLLGKAAYRQLAGEAVKRVGRRPDA